MAEAAALAYGFAATTGLGEAEDGTSATGPALEGLPAKSPSTPAEMPAPHAESPSYVPKWSRSDADLLPARRTGILAGLATGRSPRPRAHRGPTRG